MAEPAPFFSWGQALVKERGEVRITWRDGLIVAILASSGSGQLLGGLGQGRVVDQLEALKVSIDKATDELLAQRKEYERFKDETNLRLKDLELTMRKDAYRR